MADTQSMGISTKSSILIGGLLFGLFSVVKSVDVGKSLMGAGFDNWVKVWFSTSVILLKLVVQTVLYLFVLFLGFTLLVLALVYIINQLTQSGDMFKPMNVMRTLSNVFLGYFRIDNGILASFIVLPFFVSFFVALFACTMFKPKKSSENDDNKEKVQSTTKHYLLMLVLLLHFAVISSALVYFMTNS